MRLAEDGSGKVELLTLLYTQAAWVPVVLLVVYLQFKRAESWMELERSFPSTLFSGHLKTQIDPRAVSELGWGPPVSVGQAGTPPHWAAAIKEKTARARENNSNIVGGGDSGGRRGRVKVPHGWMTSGRGVRK